MTQLLSDFGMLVEELIEFGKLPTIQVILILSWHRLCGRTLRRHARLRVLW